MQRCIPLNNANGPSQGLDSLRICFWNAGGLTRTKFTELLHLLETFDTDAFMAAEAGACTENDFYSTSGYHIYELKRFRQVASPV